MSAKIWYVCCVVYVEEGQIHIQSSISLRIFTVLILSNLFSLASAAPIPTDTDGDGLPDSIELWLLNENPTILDDASNPVSATVANLYLDGDSDGIPDIIEDNLTQTDKTVDDTQVCLGGGSSGVDTTGQWDVRVSSDLTQPVDFLADILSGVSVCHTSTTLTVYDPSLGFADTANFNVALNNFTASWTGPGTAVSIDTTYSATGGDHLGPRLEGTAIIDGENFSFRADLRHILDGSEPTALNGIIGEQFRLNDAGGIALDFAFNPASDGLQVYIDNNVTLTVYSSSGDATPGYYVPSVGAVITKDTSIEIVDLDADGFLDDKISVVDEVMSLVVEPPVSSVGGMLRGEGSFKDLFDLDYLTSPGADTQKATYVDIFAKYQLVRGSSNTWNTASGPKAGIILLNVPTGVDTVTLTGPVGSGYEGGVDIIGGTSLKTMKDVTQRIRLPGFTDGEKVGLHKNGNNLHITGFNNDAPYNLDATYTFTFSGGPGGIDPSPVDVTYTQASLLLPLVDEANVSLDSDAYLSGTANRRTVNPLVSHTLTWPHVDNGFISAALYEIQIKMEADQYLRQFRMYFDAGTACSGGVCTAVFPPKTFLPNENYSIKIRPREGTSGAAGRNRSQTNSFYLRASGIDCSSDSVPGNVIASAPCGRYNKITTRQSPGEPDVTLDYMVHTPIGTPKAMVILFAGGNGNATITGDALTGDVASASSNFLVRAAQLFADQGYLAVTLDRPSDTDGQGSGAFDNYRVSMRAAVDIANVAALENTGDLDIFLIGTSRGAISVVSNYLLGTGIGIPSAVTSDPGTKIYVGHASLPPEDVTVPVHYLVHQDDGCAVSDPLDAPSVFARFTGLDPLYGSAGAISEMPVALSGGFVINSNPCRATTYHGFLGIENTAVDSITAWLDGILASLDGAYAGNSRPSTSPLTKDIYSNVPVKVDLFSHATDSDGDALDFAIPHLTSSRGAGLNISGSIVTYTPTGETNVTDTFVYAVTDGKGGVNNQVVILNVDGAAALTDTDGDTMVDAVDNCTQVPNVMQRDTDGDDYGNFCDPDFDNNLTVNVSDLFYLKSNFLSTDPDADLNGDGTVNPSDLFILKGMYLGPPGPSGFLP